MLRTKFELMSALFNCNCREPAYVTVPKGGQFVTGILSGVEREDGSGNNFILKILVGNDRVTVFWRSED